MNRMELMKLSSADLVDLVLKYRVVMEEAAHCVRSGDQAHPVRLLEDALKLDVQSDS